MAPFQSNDNACWVRLVRHCQALVGCADDLFAPTTLAEIRLLVEEIPERGLPTPQFLIRTMIGGMLLRCLRGASADLRADLTAILLEFTAGCSAPDALRLDCLELVDRFHQAICRRRQASDAYSLRGVRGVIQARYCEANLSLRQVAAEVQLSISHLSRLLNRDLGCSFRAHLNRLRVSHAQRLLQTSTLSIKEVAAAVGYQNTSQLDRHFRQLCATTPASFRRSALSPTQSQSPTAIAGLHADARGDRSRRSTSSV